MMSRLLSAAASSLGSRLINSTARSMAKQFFDKFAILTAGGDPNAPPEEEAEEGEEEARARGLPRHVQEEALTLSSSLRRRRRGGWREAPGGVFQRNRPMT